MSIGNVRHFGGERFRLVGVFPPNANGDRERRRTVTLIHNLGWHFRRVSVAAGIAVYTDAPDANRPRPDWLPDEWQYWPRRELAVLRPDCGGDHEGRVPAYFAAEIRNEDGTVKRRVNWCGQSACEQAAKAAICGGDDGE